MRNTPLIGLSVLLLLSACANLPDEQRTQTEGAGAGALLGGLLGYAIDRERGAAVGALIGAGAGFMVGNEIAKRKQNYASTEDLLEGEALRVAEFNDTARAHNERTRADIARLEREADSLRSQYAAGRVKRDQLETRRAQLQSRIQANQQLEQTLTQEYEVQTAILAEQRKARPANDPQLQKLQHEVNTLQAHLHTLREDSLQLALIEQRLSV